jgi:hypothetical protein
MQRLDFIGAVRHIHWLLDAKVLKEVKKEIFSERVKSSVTYIKYDNPLLNNSLLLNFFNALYGTKALSDLIEITSILSNDCQDYIKEMCGT